MRAFVISITLLLVTSATIVCNAIYVSKTADALIKITDKAISSDKNDSAIYIFEEKWERSRGILILSTNHDNIFKIDTLIKSAKDHLNSKNAIGYRQTVILIGESLAEIKRFEEFSLNNFL